MATEKTAPAPAPEPSITEQANASIAAAKTGRDPLKPFRYAMEFIGGTLRDGLNGISKWGAFGFKLGLAVGLVLAIASPAIPVLAAFGGIATAMASTLIGFGVGIAAGGTYGVLTGGTRAIGRMHRAEKYAEDLLVRGEQQSRAAPNRADYRRRRDALRRREDAEEERQFLERLNERERDARTYGGVSSSSDMSWVDRVSNSSSSNINQGMGI